MLWTTTTYASIWTGCWLLITNSTFTSCGVLFSFFFLIKSKNPHASAEWSPVQANAKGYILLWASTTLGGLALLWDTSQCTIALLCWCSPCFLSSAVWMNKLELSRPELLFSASSTVSGGRKVPSECWALQLGPSKISDGRSLFFSPQEAWEGWPFKESTCSR